VTELNTLDPPPMQAAHEDYMGGSHSQDGNESFVEHKVDATARNPESDAASDSDQNSNELLGKLPPEIGMLLVVSGVAGVLLPGLVGTPLLIAGGVTIWPKTFEPIERWFSRRFPSAHKEGVIQIKEFISDLQKRFPDETK
jgi:hypothetical protein